MKKDIKHIRTDALPQDGASWAEALWEGTNLTHEALRIHDIIPSTDKACNKALRDCIVDLVDGGLEHYLLNANLKQIFVYSEETRDSVDVLNGTDGVCYWMTKTANPACMIGICERAINQGHDYLMGVLLHELAHGLMRFDETEHNFAFYVLVDALASQVNDRLGTNIHPDYNDMDVADAGRIMFGASRSNTDGVDHGVERDLESIRSRHNKRTGGK